ncbi:response regulator transcription factor [Yinghuangia aomiensis]
MITPLSDRELDVLRQAAQLLSNEEIAATLCLSANTVKTHLASIYRKLCVARRSEAVHKARDLGVLVTPDAGSPGSGDAWHVCGG